MVRLVGLIIKTPVIGQKCPVMGEGADVGALHVALSQHLVQH